MDATALRNLHAPLEQKYRDSAAVATAMGVEVRGGRIVAAGHRDARGTPGIDKTAPVGLTDITLGVELDTPADAATVQRLLELTERYCAIYQTPKNPPQLSAQLRTG